MTKKRADGIMLYKGSRTLGGRFFLIHTDDNGIKNANGSEANVYEKSFPHEKTSTDNADKTTKIELCRHGTIIAENNAKLKTKGRISPSLPAFNCNIKEIRNDV
jgi:hypothetical protein